MAWVSRVMRTRETSSMPPVLIRAKATAFFHSRQGLWQNLVVYSRLYNCRLGQPRRSVNSEWPGRTHLRWRWSRR